MLIVNFFYKDELMESFHKKMDGKKYRRVEKDVLQWFVKVMDRLHECVICTNITCEIFCESCNAEAELVPVITEFQEHSMQCCICMEPNNTYSLQICENKHALHFMCFRRYNKDEDMRCPVCRCELTRD